MFISNSSASKRPWTTFLISWNVPVLLWINELFADFFTVQMCDIVFVEWTKNSFRFFMEILSSQISVDGIEWTPRTWYTAPISYQIFLNTFSSMNYLDIHADTYCA